MSLLDDAGMIHRVTTRRLKHARANSAIAISRDSEVLRTDVPAWIQNRRRSGAVEFQKKDERITYYVFFNTPPGLRPKDEIVVTSGPSFVGKTFEFMATSERTAGLGLAYGVIAQEINNLREPFLGLAAAAQPIPWESDNDILWTDANGVVWVV